MSEEKNTNKVESASNAMEVIGRDLSKRLIYLSVELNLSEVKLIDEISLLTNTTLTKYHLDTWKKSGDKVVSPYKVEQIDSYFKAKGLSCIKSSMDKFKTSVDEYRKDASGEGKDFVKSNDQDYHPHTKVVDSFDNLSLVKESKDNISENDFISFKFKQHLNLSKEDRKKRKKVYLKLIETIDCADALDSIGDE